MLACARHMRTKHHTITIIQVDVTAAGSLGRHDFSLALDRAGVDLPTEDKDALFRSLSSARTAGVGCDIEMFAYLIKFWAG